LNNIVVCREKLVNSNLRVYTPNPTLMFALSDTKVIVITNFHTFFLRHTHRNYLPRLNNVRQLIEANKINNAADLLTELKLNVGEGIEMVVTKIDRVLEENK